MATDTTSTTATADTSTILAGGDEAAPPAAAGTGEAAPAKVAGEAPAGDAAKVASDAKAAADKAAADAPLELKLPDHLKDDAAFGKFKGLAKELGLKAEGAQKIADLYVAAQVEAAKQTETELTKLRSDWAASVKSDKELGGAAFEASKLAGRQALEKFGSPELKSYLQETGLGNHPEVVRLLTRIGKAIAEDSVSGTTGTKGAAAATDEMARLRARYPNSPGMFPKES